MKLFYCGMRQEQFCEWGEGTQIICAASRQEIILGTFMTARREVGDLLLKRDKCGSNIDESGKFD